MTRRESNISTRHNAATRRAVAVRKETARKLDLVNRATTLNMLLKDTELSATILEDRVVLVGSPDVLVEVAELVKWSQGDPEDAS